MPRAKPLNSRAEVRDIKKRKPKKSITRGGSKPKTKPRSGRGGGGSGYGGIKGAPRKLGY